MADEKVTTEEKQEEAAAPQVEGATEIVAEIKPKTALEEIIVETEKATTTKRGKSKIEFKPIAKEDIVPGMVVRVHQKIVDINTKGEEKERIQVFQGMVIARKHGSEAGATITVRKVSEGVGVERIYPLNMPAITKFELVRQFVVNQARPYYLRTYKKKLKEVA
jgi:large subunit ribosomal protein L19